VCIELYILVLIGISLGVCDQSINRIFIYDYEVYIAPIDKYYFVEQRDSIYRRK